MPSFAAASAWGELAVVEQTADTARRPPVGAWSADHAARQAMPARPVNDRCLTVEVETGFSAESACTEAARCYLCCHLVDLDANLCVHCGACLEVRSADRCIVPTWGPTRRTTAGTADATLAEFFKDRARLAINQDACIRCGECVDVCPAHCIHIRKITRLPGAAVPSNGDY